MQPPRTASEAALQTRIADRAAKITEDYHCTIHPDDVKVTHNDDLGRSYIVKDGACTCASFKKHGTCKHSLGIVALVEAEIARLQRLVRIMDSEFLRRAIANGLEIAEAARCEMSLQLYRECCRRADELAA